MQKVIATLAATVAVAALATPADAAPAGNFRADIHAGYDHVSAEGAGDTSDGGIIYGIGLGYDFDIGKRGFIGPDFSLDDSTMKECEASILAANDELCIKAGRDIAVGLRGGLKLGDRGKLYALAGYTNARFKTSYTTPAGVTTSDAENLDGWRIGAGYEHKIAGNAYAKVEYRYSNYEADVDRHQALVGVGLTF